MLRSQALLAAARCPRPGRRPRRSAVPRLLSACTRTSSTSRPGGRVSSSAQRPAGPLARALEVAGEHAQLGAVAQRHRLVARTSAGQRLARRPRRTLGVGVVAGEPAQPRQPALGVADLVDVAELLPDLERLPAGRQRPRRCDPVTYRSYDSAAEQPRPGARRARRRCAAAPARTARPPPCASRARPPRRRPPARASRPRSPSPRPRRGGPSRAGRRPASATSASRIRRCRPIRRSRGTSSTIASRASSWRNISTSPWSCSTPAPSASSRAASLPGETAAASDSSARGPASATTSSASRAGADSRAVRDSTASCTLRGTASPPAASTSVT